MLPFCHNSGFNERDHHTHTQEREAVVVAVQLGRRRLGAVIVPPSAECGDRRRRLGAAHRATDDSGVAPGPTANVLWVGSLLRHFVCEEAPAV